MNVPAAPHIELIAIPHIPLIQPGDDLPGLVLAAAGAAGIDWRDRDVLVLAQKIVSKAEGRLVHLPDVLPSARALELAALTGKDPRLVEVILGESAEVLRVRPGLLVVEHRLGFVCANAGVDQSNVAGSDDWALLLPVDPDASARRLRDAIRKATGADVAVIISDSHGRAWRFGTVGVAIGVAGLHPLSDLRGQPDLDRPALADHRGGHGRRARGRGRAADGPGWRGDAGRAGARRTVRGWGGVARR